MINRQSVYKIEIFFSPHWFSVWIVIDTSQITSQASVVILLSIWELVIYKMIVQFVLLRVAPGHPAEIPFVMRYKL